MLIPLEAKGFYSLLSYWLAFGAGHWRGQFKRSPCYIAHDRLGPLSGQQVLTGPMDNMLGSGRAVWRPGLQAPLREVRAAAQPALFCGSVARGVLQENHRGAQSPCSAHPWSQAPAESSSGLQEPRSGSHIGTRGHEDRVVKEIVTEK